MVVQLHCDIERENFLESLPNRVILKLLKKRCLLLLWGIKNAYQINRHGYLKWGLLKACEIKASDFVDKFLHMLFINLKPWNLVKPWEEEKWEGIL